MNANDKLLVQALATIDAVFIPCRSHVYPLSRYCHQMRRGYAANGIPWRSGDGDEATRKAGRRGLDGLAAAGLLRVIRRRAVKTVGVILTDAGDAKGRALAGLPSLAQSLSLVEEMADAPKAEVAGKRWVSEIHLAGLGCWGETADADKRKMLVWVEEMALPAMLRGWIESNSDTAGRVWYCLTAAGAKALEAGDGMSKPNATEDAAARVLYYETAKAELANRGAIEPPDLRDIGPIALPCAMLTAAK